MDIVTGHPFLPSIFQGLEELVGQPVAGLVPEDQVRGLLAVLPDGQGSKEVFHLYLLGEVQHGVDGRYASDVRLGPRDHGPEESAPAPREVGVDLLPEFLGAVAILVFYLCGEADLAPLLAERDGLLQTAYLIVGDDVCLAAMGQGLRALNQHEQEAVADAAAELLLVQVSQELAPSHVTNDGDVGFGRSFVAVLRQVLEWPVVPSIAHDHGQSVGFTAHDGERGGELGLFYEQTLV